MSAAKWKIETTRFRRRLFGAAQGMDLAVYRSSEVSSTRG